MFWKDVGDDLWRFVKNVFEMGSYDAATTETLMVLIPKGDHPTSFKNFRPISLCNVTYKIIYKVLVTRLRPFLNDIISPLQNSFILGRSTKDNAIILQEIIYHMNKKNKKKGDMVFKLDLEKAYDKLDWSFLKQTLIMFGFPANITSLIMHSLASTLISLLWNGSKTECFTPTRGLRQGDPLSPYLYVFCMERLGEMIQDEVRVGRWLPLQASANGPSISHLFYADDELLFAKAKPSQARVINKILEDVCSISGLKVSLEKSRAFASADVTRNRKDSVTSTTRIQFTSNLGKYLGFQMHHGRIKKEDFSSIMDRVSNKLASWKGRLLNKPGHVTLANSVLTAIPAHNMQIQWLPQYVCDHLDKTVCSFIWKGSTNKGMHMVGWEKITKAKKNEGLGVRIARKQNIVLLAKLVWDMLKPSNHLWSQILSAKYL